MRIRTVRTVAAYELKINVRNKWTLLFAFVFAALAVAISYFGLVTEAVVGFQGFTRTTASLLNLALYLIPMIALAMGALSFTGEKGASELLFSQPVMRGEILAGKLAGLFLSLAAATLLGFGAAGLLIAVQVGIDGLARYLAFVGFALLLAAAFLSLGAMTAILAGGRAKGLGFALFVWFVFVLFFDLLVMGVAFLLPEHAANQFIFLSLFANPVDLGRVGSLIAMGDPAVFGYAGAALVKFLGGAALANVALIGGLLIWIAAPLAISGRVLGRQDI
ncbi:MAG: ABC transporter permease subunit [Acidobacteriia bacterium]|nr:ABC transporter permease subunit [Terriglobia bacterium]